MKISEIICENADFDKAELILSLGRRGSPDDEPLDHKRLEELSTAVASAYQKNPNKSAELKEAAIILSSAAADYIEVIDNHPSKNDPTIQELRKKIDDIRQSNLDLYNQ